jgi:hypothetical protein
LIHKHPTSIQVFEIYNFEFKPNLRMLQPLRLAAARKDEASSGREQGGEQLGNKGKKQEAAGAK